MIFWLALSALLLIALSELFCLLMKWKIEVLTKELEEIEKNTQETDDEIISQYLGKNWKN